jgi:hypothetical protein
MPPGGLVRMVCFQIATASSEGKALVSSSTDGESSDPLQ